MPRGTSTRPTPPTPAFRSSDRTAPPQLGGSAVSGVAVDRQGNVYVTNASRVLKLPAGAPAVAAPPSVAPGPAPAPTEPAAQSPPSVSATPPVLARVVQRADGSLY